MKSFLQPFLCVWARRRPAARRRSCSLGESGTRPDGGRQSGRAGTHSGPWTHQHPGHLKHTQTQSLQIQKQRFLFLSWNFGSYSQTSNAHVCVRVVKLHHDVGRSGHRDLGVAENLHLVEDERLVPGGIESVTHRHSFLGLVEERHNGVGVWRDTDQNMLLRRAHSRTGGIVMSS